MDQLRQGNTVSLRPRGHSMTGKVNDGDLVVVEPVDDRQLQPGDIVTTQLTSP